MQGVKRFGLGGGSVRRRRRRDLVVWTRGRWGGMVGLGRLWCRRGSIGRGW